MNALTRKLPRVTPPFWLVSMVAAAVGAMLMVAFIDALHDNIRHGEQLRQAQRISNVRQVMSTSANMTLHSQSPRGTLTSSTYQR